MVEPVVKKGNNFCFNPYPILGAPSSPLAWPRGMPLDSILNSGTNPSKIFMPFRYRFRNFSLLTLHSQDILLFLSETTQDQNYLRINGSHVNFSVLQSVADYQPDVDAIFRLTRKTPFTFRRPTGVQEGLFIIIFFKLGNNL